MSGIMLTSMRERSHWNQHVRCVSALPYLSLTTGEAANACTLVRQQGSRTHRAPRASAGGRDPINARTIRKTRRCEYSRTTTAAWLHCPPYLGHTRPQKHSVGHRAAWKRRAQRSPANGTRFLSAPIRAAGPQRFGSSTRRRLLREYSSVTSPWPCEVLITNEPSRRVF